MVYNFKRSRLPGALCVIVLHCTLLAFSNFTSVSVDPSEVPQNGNFYLKWAQTPTSPIKLPFNITINPPLGRESQVTINGSGYQQMHVPVHATVGTVFTFQAPGGLQANLTVTPRNTSTKRIIGGVVGGILGIGVLSLLIWFIRRRKNKTTKFQVARHDTEASSEQSNMTPEPFIERPSSTIDPLSVRKDANRTPTTILFRSAQPRREQDAGPLFDAGSESGPEARTLPPDYNQVFTRSDNPSTRTEYGRHTSSSDIGTSNQKA